MRDARSLWEALESLQTRIEEIEEDMASKAKQSDVDALTAQINQVQADLVNTQRRIQDEVNNLSTANPGVDLTALQAAIAPLDTTVQALGTVSPQTTTNESTGATTTTPGTPESTGTSASSSTSA